MISGIFETVRLVLQLLKLWDLFLNWQEENKIAVRHEKAIAREAAIKAGIEAKTEEDIWKAQEDVVKNRPSP